jgi:hypothetical protein
MHVFLVIRLNAFSLLTVKCIWLLGHSQSNKCDPPIHLLPRARKMYNLPNPGGIGLKGGIDTIGTDWYLYLIPIKCIQFT